MYYSSDNVYILTYEGSFDLYLFDVNVLGESGFKILKALRDSGDTTSTIFITVLTDIDSLREGVSVGADNYIKNLLIPKS